MRADEDDRVVMEPRRRCVRAPEVGRDLAIVIVDEKALTLVLGLRDEWAAVAGHSDELRVGVLCDERAVNAVSRQRTDLSRKLGIEPGGVTNGGTRASIREPSLARVASHDDLASAHEHHLRRARRASARRRIERQRDRDAEEQRGETTARQLSQNRPRARSLAGSTSRHVVHHPVRIVSTNSGGNDSASISRASASAS